MSAEELDTTVAHPARRYNYWLGGKDNFAADRESGDLIARTYPSTVLGARENRAFLQRAVRYLAGEAGIRQFLDIGTGLPTADNTHEVAQRIAPETRIVYVDNDPMVMVHARALLTSTDEGETVYLEEDLRNPAAILGHADLKATLDLDRPVALMIIAVLHFIPEQDQAVAVVRELVDALPSGSYLTISIATSEFLPPEVAAAFDAMVAKGQVDVWARTRTQFAEFFAGLDLVAPGIVAVSEWRPDLRPADATPPPPPGTVSIFGAVGRKP